MSETDLDIDKDDFTDASTTFPQKFKLANTFLFGNKPVRHLGNFILQPKHGNDKHKKFPGVCGQASENICCVNDKGSIAVYNIQKSNQIWGCDSLDNITGLSVFEQNKLLCSTQDNIKMWDTRQAASGQPVMVMEDTSQKARGCHYNCVSVNTSGLVVAGTEQIRDESFLLFWDTRQSGKLQGGYWETHCDDITSVQFKPGSENILATGCTDGLVNILDVAVSDEDDALVTSHNTQDSVARLLWYSTSKGDEDNLAIQTHTEAVQLWHTPDCSAHTVLDRDSVCHGIRRTVSEFTYIAGLLPPSSSTSSGLTVLAGSRCPGHTCLRLGQIRNKKVKPMSLMEGLGGVVTSCTSLGDHLVITGTENGVVTTWREGDVKEDHSDLKISNKISKSLKIKPY